MVQMVKLRLAIVDGIKVMYSRLSRCFTARGFSTGAAKGIRLISSKVTKLPPKIVSN